MFSILLVNCESRHNNDEEKLYCTLNLPSDSSSLIRGPDWNPQWDLIDQEVSTFSFPLFSLKIAHFHFQNNFVGFQKISRKLFWRVSNFYSFRLPIYFFLKYVWFYIFTKYYNFPWDFETWKDFERWHSVKFPFSLSLFLTSLGIPLTTNIWCTSQVLVDSYFSFKRKCLSYTTLHKKFTLLQ